MKTRVNKSITIKPSSIAGQSSRRSGKGESEPVFAYNRHRLIAPGNIARHADNSPRAARIAQLTALASDASRAFSRQRQSNAGDGVGFQSQILQKNGTEGDSVPQAYKDVKSMAEKNDLLTSGLFEKFGGGVTKQAFGVKGSPWVVLAVTESKKRVLAAEVEQLISLRGKVAIPDIGPVKSAGEAIFKVSIQGKPNMAFLEEKVSGFEIPRASHAFTGDEIKRFPDLVIDEITNEKELPDAVKKLSAAKESIGLIEKHISTKDIPDFQVRYNKSTGQILTLDPGDPLSSENAQQKHLRWLQSWAKVFADGRYLSRQWNKKHPDKKSKIADWN